MRVSASACMCLWGWGAWRGVRLCQGHGSPPPRAKRDLTQKPSTLAVRVSVNGSLSGTSAGLHGPQRQHESSLGFWKASRWKADPPTHQQAGRNVCTPRSGSICSTPQSSGNGMDLSSTGLRWEDRLRRAGCALTHTDRAVARAATPTLSSRRQASWLKQSRTQPCVACWGLCLSQTVGPHTARAAASPHGGAAVSTHFLTREQAACRHPHSTCPESAALVLLKLICLLALKNTSLGSPRGERRGGGGERNARQRRQLRAPGGKRKNHSDPPKVLSCKACASLAAGPACERSAPRSHTPLLTNGFRWGEQRTPQRFTSTDHDKLPRKDPLHGGQSRAQRDVLPGPGSHSVTGALTSPTPRRKPAPAHGAGRSQVWGTP